MISTQRIRSPPPQISNPMPAEQVDYYSPTRSDTPLASPPKTPPKGHRPSFSKGINWLSRGSGSSGSSVPHGSPHKPIRISEPKFTNSLEILHAPRSGALGSGATVVKTPHEALCVQLTEEEEAFDIKSEHGDIENGEDECVRLPSPPHSPALPPLPQEDSDSLSELSVFKKASTSSLPIIAPVASSSKHASQWGQDTLRHGLKAAAGKSLSHHTQGSLKSRKSSGSSLSIPEVPLPADVTASVVAPPFDPILVGPSPTTSIDPSKIIVSVETATSTQRTTMTTLTSRPSHLSLYLNSLLSKADPDAASVYSQASEVSTPQDTSFNSIFHQHLTSSGLLSQASSAIHVFLDRPSAPYAHIMGYLRSPPATSESPATLPRSILLIPSSFARLEALLELRDEANYLGLEELHKLCVDEIQKRDSAFSYTRVGSTGSVASLHSVHTFREQPEGRPRRGSNATHRSAPLPEERQSVVSEAAVPAPAVEPPRAMSSATRHSHSRSQSRGRTLAGPRDPPNRALPSPPPGWI